MSDPLIETRNLSKDYRVGSETVQALRGVSVSIAAGEYVAVMGPSGSGKSTFMNVLGCLDRPTGGDYLLDTRNVARLDDDALAAVRNRSIGFVFQNFNLLARTSAADNVALPLIYAGIGRAERQRRALSALQRVGLTTRAGHRPNQLSGGQQQRVAIARALVIEPRLLLADEPTGALDSQTGADIMRLFDELHHAGHTILLITHEQEIAGHARRIIRFRDGRVESDSARQS